MNAPKCTYFLEVVGGEDRGARLAIERSVRTVGRARDVDLVLTDLTVSRRHVQVLATDSGVQFAVCDGAAPLIVNGRAVREFDAVSGDRVAVGKTTLAVIAEVAEPPSSRRTEGHGRTDIRTLLTGVAADVRGLASLHALIEALDAAADTLALERALGSWATDHVAARSIEIRRGPDAQATSVEIVERADGDGTLIVLPAPSDEPTSVAFTTSTPADRVTDSYRRMLVLAGRLLGSALTRVRHLEVAADEVEALRTLSFGSARAFMGTSPGALHLASLVPKLAASDVSVLLEGETGVGKTFVARLVHESGDRAHEPLRIINCAAIPENLLESELFGHERGAFTGSVAVRAGAFEAVGRGTLFLDEVGELSAGSQAKLLRALEERRFERIGSNRSLELRARIICATNRDLEEMARAGQFRSDLFFRISVVRVAVPALRERGDDLLLLAKQILSDLARSAARRVTGFSPEAIECIRRYPWPGNVRELRNAIEHAIALGDGPSIKIADLPPGLSGPVPQPETHDLVRLPLALASLERRGIEAALRSTNGNRLRAAALLGINRTTLYSKLREYDLADADRGETG